jgi:hypothetical protein
MDSLIFILSHQDIPRTPHTTGKICVAVQHFFAVCPRTAKKSLPCAQIKTHGKDLGHGKDRHKRTAKIRLTAKMEEAARQRKVHGNGPTHRTAKTWCTAKALGIAVPHPLPCAQLGCTAKQPLPSVFEKRTAKKPLPSVSARQRCKNWIFSHLKRHGMV